MIPKTLLLIKQIRPRAPQIDNLRTPVSVLLQARALKAVERVADALAAAHDAFVLVVAEGALVADAHERRGPHVRVTHGTLAVALVAEAADRDARLLAAHYEVGVMAGHGCCWLSFVVGKGGGGVGVRLWSRRIRIVDGQRREGGEV